MRKLFRSSEITRKNLLILHAIQSTVPKLLCPKKIEDMPAAAGMTAETAAAETEKCYTLYKHLNIHRGCLITWI